MKHIFFNNKSEIVPVGQAHFDSGEFTVKKWLQSLLIKIKDYNGNNKYILEAQKQSTWKLR